MAGPRKKTSKGMCRVTVSYDVVNELGNKVKKLKYIERKTWVAADKAAAEFRAEQGKPKPPPSGTLAQALAEVDAAIWVHRSPQTQRCYRHYRAKVEAVLGHRPVAEITSPEITRYLARFEGKITSRTIAEHVKVISAALQFAVTDLGWIERNAAKDCRRPRGKVKAPAPALTRKTFDRVRPYLTETERLLCDLLAETAMRPNEAMRATAEHVVYRFDRDWIDVRQSKTKAGVRLVPISPGMADRMREAGDPFAEYRAVGFPIERLSKRWKVAFEAMIAAWDGDTAERPAYTNVYKIRAMRLTEWARARMDRDLLKIVAGHSDAHITDRFYIDLGAEDAAAALDAMGVPLGGRAPANEARVPI